VCMWLCEWGGVSVPPGKSCSLQRPAATASQPAVAAKDPPCCVGTASPVSQQQGTHRAVSAACAQSRGCRLSRSHSAYTDSASAALAACHQRRCSCCCCCCCCSCCRCCKVTQPGDCTQRLRTHHHDGHTQLAHAACSATRGPTHSIGSRSTLSCGISLCNEGRLARLREITHMLLTFARHVFLCHNSATFRQFVC
jgi:hypothetical protein